MTRSVRLIMGNQPVDVPLPIPPYLALKCAGEIWAMAHRYTQGCDTDWDIIQVAELAAAAVSTALLSTRPDLTPEAICNLLTFPEAGDFLTGVAAIARTMLIPEPPGTKH